MNTTNTIYLSALSVFLILISGCITGPAATTGNGVIIKDYDVEFSDAYGGECIDFGILIKNTGSVTAENIFVELLGLDEDWYDSDQISWGRGCRSQDGGAWDRREKRANEPECRFDAYKSTEVGGSGGYSITLLPPDPLRGTNGEEKHCTWTYMAPRLPKDTDITYTPTMRVYYQYHTDVIKAITLMSKDEMKNLIEQGKTLPIDTQSSSSSPIKIDVVTSTPIRMYSDSIEFPITINIENVGGGVACVGRGSDENYNNWDSIQDCRPSQEPDKSWNKLMLEIDAGSGISLSSDCDIQNPIILYKGDTNSITCTATVDSIPLERIQKMIHVRADYNYFIDKEIQITVHGNV